MGGAWEWRGGDMHHRCAGTRVQRHLCDRNMINAFHYSSVIQSSISTHTTDAHAVRTYVRIYVQVYFNQLLPRPLARVGVTSEEGLTCKQ